MDYIIPGSTYNLTYTVSIPPNVSQTVVLYAAMPVNQSASMTITSLKVVDMGANIGCFSFLDTTSQNVTYTSSKDTTQKDKAELDMGVITNAGECKIGYFSFCPGCGICNYLYCPITIKVSK